MTIRASDAIQKKIFRAISPVHLTVGRGRSPAIRLLIVDLFQVAQMVHDNWATERPAEWPSFEVYGREGGSDRVMSEFWSTLAGVDR